MLPSDQRLRALNALGKIISNHWLAPESVEADHDHE